MGDGPVILFAGLIALVCVFVAVHLVIWLAGWIGWPVLVTLALMLALWVWLQS